MAEVPDSVVPRAVFAHRFGAPLAGRGRMIFLRSLAYSAWFYLSIVIIGLGCLPASLFSRGAAMSAVRLWAGSQRVALRVLCGIKTEFRGMEHLPKGKCIIALKHQSTYDTIAPFLFIH